MNIPLHTKRRILRNQQRSQHRQRLHALENKKEVKKVVSGLQQVEPPQPQHHKKLRQQPLISKKQPQQQQQKQRQYKILKHHEQPQQHKQIRQQPQKQTEKQQIQQPQKQHLQQPKPVAQHKSKEFHGIHAQVVVTPGGSRANHVTHINPNTKFRDSEGNIVISHHSLHSMLKDQQNEDEKSGKTSRNPAMKRETRSGMYRPLAPSTSSVRRPGPVIVPAWSSARTLWPDVPRSWKFVSDEKKRHYVELRREKRSETFPEGPEKRSETYTGSADSAGSVHASKRTSGTYKCTLFFLYSLYVSHGIAILYLLKGDDL